MLNCSSSTTTPPPLPPPQSFANSHLRHRRGSHDFGFISFFTLHGSLKGSREPNAPAFQGIVGVTERPKAFGLWLDGYHDQGGTEAWNTAFLPTLHAYMSFFVNRIPRRNITFKDHQLQSRGLFPCSVTIVLMLHRYLADGSVVPPSHTSPHVITPRLNLGKA
jgi:hypothetical protein